MTDTTDGGSGATEAPGTAGKPDAPGALALVQQFVNTVDLEGAEEGLRTPAGLAAWLRAHNLLEEGAGADNADLQAAIALRETFRELLYANNGEPLPDDAFSGLDHLAEFPLVAYVRDDGALGLRPLLDGVRGALARIVAAACAASADGTWARLKACRSDTCRWAFYDTSKNRSGTWCNMAVCGNRAKVRAYQQRRRGGSAPKRGDAP